MQDQSNLAGVHPSAVQTSDRMIEYVSDAMVEVLYKLNVDYVFLVPGSSYRGLHDSLVNFGRNTKPKIVLCVHEQIAVSMAHGYAKASGRIGVCILHDLVGLMNGSMGVYNAFADGAPVLILGGSGPLDPADRRWIDWIHCASTQSDLVKHYTKWTEEPTTAQWHLDAIAKAYRYAMSAPRGPVYVTLDCGIQEQLIEETWQLPNLDYYKPAPPIGPNMDILKKAAAALMGAKLPLIVGGRVGLSADAAAPLIELVEMLGATYIDDNGFVAFPTGHNQNVSGDKSILNEADVILALDCRDVASLLDGYTHVKERLGSGAVRDGRTVINMSLHDVFPQSWSYISGKQAPIDLQLQCEPIFGMTCLLNLIREMAKDDTAFLESVVRKTLIAAKRHSVTRARQVNAVEEHSRAAQIHPSKMVAEVWEAVKEKNWILAMRNQASFPDGVWQFPGAGSYLGTNGGGGVGYGPGAAAGAAIACRDSGRFCVAIMGDGDFIMSAGAIWSAVNNAAPMLLIINNNTTWGNDEKHQVQVAIDRGRPVENAGIGQRMDAPEIDHAAIARGFGAWAAGPIHEPGKLRAALAEAVQQVEKGLVAVVDVRTSFGR